MRKLKFLFWALLLVLVCSSLVFSQVDYKQAKSTGGKWFIVNTTTSDTAKTQSLTGAFDLLNVGLKIRGTTKIDSFTVIVDTLRLWVGAQQYNALRPGAGGSGLSAISAWSILLNNTASSAVPTGVTISALTDRASFGIGDKLAIEESTGELRKIDFSDLPGAGGGLSNIVEDTTPQLGGQLDVNLFSLGDGTLELLSFIETGSAINELTITNAAIGGSPSLTATGDDTNINLTLDGAGTGTVRTLSSNLDITGNIIASGTVDGTVITASSSFSGPNVTSGANPGHTHTGSSLSSIDISDDTNLTAGTNITLTDDDLAVDDAFLVNDAADEMLLADATTNVVTDILDLSHTGGTPAAGFGTGIRFDIEDAGGIEEQASIDVSLDVVTDAAEEASIIFRHNVAGTMQESMRIDGTAGNVGIGTAAPVAPLDIQSLAASMRQTRYSDTASQSAGITVQRSGGTIVGTDVVVQDGWRIANFNLRGFDGSIYRTAAAIEASIDGTPGAGDMPGRLVFSTTADGASSATERLRIDSNGNVGIGTTTPLEELHVVGEIFLVHTATGADEHAFEMDVDAAGFGDIKGLEINYDTGAISTGEIAVAILVDINEIDAVGGDVIGIEILATDGGADNIVGIKIGAEVAPLLQDSGVFANPTLATNNTNTTDVPAMRDNSVLTNTTIFAADDDFIIIGAGAAFTQMEFVIETGFGNPGIQPVFAFSTSGTNQFTNFTPTDGTDGFKSAGAFVVAWDADEVPGHVADDVTGTFNIRITRTANPAGNVSLFYARSAATRTFEIDVSGNARFLSYILEGSTDDAFEQTIGTVDPTADRAFTLPDDQIADLDMMLGTGAGTFGYSPMSGGATMTNAGVVTIVTNANLTGVITSVGNATSIASQTGTGTTFAMNTSPVFVTPTLGVASATSIATSAAIPLLLTNGQLVNIALTSQTVGATTLTIPDFASVVDEFTFNAFSATLTNKVINDASNTLTILETSITDGTLLARVGSIETITANWVNTANPWADNEVTDALTLAGGVIGTSAITLVQSAAPIPTAEGVIEWETDDDHIIVGDGIAAVEFVPAEDVSGSITMTDAGVTTIGATQVTNAMHANMAQNTIKMRVASGAGDPEDIDISAGLALVTAVSGDFVVIEDATDGGLKRANVGDFLGGGVTWDAIGDAAGPAGINMAEQAQTLDWNTAATAAAFDGLEITLTNDATSDAARQVALKISRPASSGTATVEALLEINNEDTDGAVTVGIEIIAGSAGGMPTAIDASSVFIENAISIGGNAILTSGATITAAELNRLDGLTSVIIDADQIDTFDELNTIVADRDLNAVLVADNESSAETNALVFLPGGDLDGGILLLESDGDLNYNPSTGTLTATEFVGGGVGITGVTASHTGTIIWTGTSIQETGAAHQFGDGTDATVTHTYANTGTDVVIAYSTAAMAVTGVLTANNLSGTNTGDELSSSVTVQGVIEVATAAEINTATSAVLALSPDTFAGSDAAVRYFTVLVTDDYDVAMATGDDQSFFITPGNFGGVGGIGGMNLVYVHAHLITVGTTGTANIQIRNQTQAGVNMLSTAITIDTTERGSDTAATPAVIDGDNDDVADFDVLAFDVDVIHTTPGQGLIVTLGFQLP